MSRCGRPSQTCDHLAVAEYQILQVLANRLFVSKIVILLDQAVEQCFLRSASHLLKIETAQLLQRSAYSTIVRYHRVRRFPFGYVVAHFETDGRQLDMPGAL